MPTRLRQNRKKRGHVSAGHGRVGKHRKHPGGRGNAGPEHHHRINTFKYHPGYIGKHGMRIFRLQRNRKWCATINAESLWCLLSRDQQAEHEKDSSKKPVIDVTRVGYGKVLGTCHGPLKHAMIVRAREFSKSAKEKIEAAGGECQVLGLVDPNQLRAAPKSFIA